MLILRNKHREAAPELGAFFACPTWSEKPPWEVGLLISVFEAQAGLVTSLLS